MNVRRLANELGWFGASILAVAAFGFVLEWIDGATGHVSSPPRDALLILAAAALVVMVFRIIPAFFMEQDTQDRRS